MDTATISSFFTLTVAAAPILGTAAMFVLGLIVWWRTGSSITILSRLWRLLHGKSSAAVPAISDYLGAQAEVARLCFETGAKLRTSQQAERLIAWSIRHDESLRDAAACGPYFDFEVPCLKDRSSQPRPMTIMAIGTAFVVLLLAILTVTLFSIPDRAILKLNTTGTWLSIDRETAKPLTGAPGFALSACHADYKLITAHSGFSQADIGALCGAFKAENMASLGRFVDHSIQSQRRVFAVMAAIMAWWAWPAYTTLRHASKANAMRARLRRKAAAGAEPTTKTDPRKARIDE